MKIVVTRQILIAALIGNAEIESILQDRESRGLTLLSPQDLLDSLDYKMEEILNQGELSIDELDARHTILLEAIKPIPFDLFAKVITLARTMVIDPENIECVALGLEFSANGVWVGKLPLLTITKSLKGLTTQTLLEKFPVSSPPEVAESEVEAPEEVKSVLAVEAAGIGEGITGQQPSLSGETELAVDPALYAPVPHNPLTEFDDLDKLTNFIYMKAVEYLRTVGLPCIIYDDEGNREEKTLTFFELPRLFLAQQVQFIQISDPDTEEVGEGNATISVSGLKRWRRDGSLVREYDDEVLDFPYGYAEQTYNFLYLFIGDYRKGQSDDLYDGNSVDVFFDQTPPADIDQSVPLAHRSPQPYAFKAEIVITPRGLGLTDEHIDRMRAAEALSEATGEEAFRRYGLQREDCIPETWYYRVVWEEGEEMDRTHHHLLAKVQDYEDYLVKTAREVFGKL